MANGESKLDAVFGVFIFINLILIGVETKYPCEETSARIRIGAGEVCQWDVVLISVGTNLSSSHPK